MVDYSNIDWTNYDAKIAKQLCISREAVRLARQRFNKFRVKKITIIDKIITRLKQEGAAIKNCNFSQIKEKLITDLQIRNINNSILYSCLNGFEYRKYKK